MTNILTFWELGFAALLLCINAAISLALSLGIFRTLLISAVRMVVQLLLLGTILNWLFSTENPLILILAMLVMGSFAGYEIAARQKTHAGRIWTTGIGTSAILFSGWFITIPVTAFLLDTTPWYSMPVILPVFGMVAGNAMTGIALALNALSTALTRDQDIIEARLAIGDTWSQAISGPFRQSIATGFMPIINSMAAMGVVSIPGMMTGQLLAGSTPIDAAKYQIFITFLIASTSAFGIFFVTLSLSRRATDGRHRLRLDRFVTVK